MQMNSDARFDVKIASIHSAKENIQMHPTANPDQDLAIDSFLRTSQEYLVPAGHAMSSGKRSMTAVLLRGRKAVHRRVIQSLLLAAGVGMLAVGPAMADSGCDHLAGNPERHAKMRELHHTRLHDALKLSGEQESAWKSFMDSERSMPGVSHGQPEEWAKLNAPERAEKMLELSKAKQVQMSEHVVALKAFYAQLTPDQQKIFEDFHGPRARVADKGEKRASGTNNGPKNP